MTCPKLRLISTRSLYGRNYYLLATVRGLGPKAKAQTTSRFPTPAHQIGHHHQHQNGDSYNFHLFQAETGSNEQCPTTWICMDCRKALI
jgi:hypothetical protein